MRAKILLTFGFLLSFFWGQETFAQLPSNSVNYLMKYDSSTCRYDIYIVINSGIADISAERVATNSNLTVVAPTGTAFSGPSSVIQTYYPRTADGLGAVVAWTQAARVNAPSGDPTHDYISFRPSLGSTGWYRKNAGTATIQGGDQIRIFSIQPTTPSTMCGRDLRLYINGQDLNSSQLGGGEDFSNGFTMGGATPQLYNANSVQQGAPIPTITDLSTTCASGIEINLDAFTSSCQGPLTYAWTGPASHTSSSQDVSIPTATAANNGLYRVIITDGIGCKDTAEILALTKPNAGTDVTICNGLTGVLTGTPSSFVHPVTNAVTTGTWGAVVTPPNPANATIVPTAAGVANVTFTNPPGGSQRTYRFFYRLGDCYDTLVYTVNPTPVVSTTDANRDLCVGEIAPSNYLSPNSIVGTWTSSVPSVIQITNNPLVIRGLSQGGPVTLTYSVNATGCTNQLTGFKVNPNPTLGLSNACVGGPGVPQSPAGGGTWSSGNTGIATFAANVLTGVSAGTVNVTYLETATGCSTTGPVTVNPRPIITLTGQDSICVLDSTTFISNINPGQWTATPSTIATITSTGIVVGQQVGSATFTFTTASTGCTSLPSAPIYVIPAPIINPFDDTKCVGDNTTLTLSTTPAGGTWSSNRTSVATINPTTGVVTIVAPGQVTFKFTSSSGCEVVSAPLTVYPRPSVSVSPNDSLCVGSSVTLSPNIVVGVTSWTNVTGNGNTTGQLLASGLTRLYRGNNPGIGKLIYSDENGCISDTLRLTVLEVPVVSIGRDPICQGDTTQLSPATGGNWVVEGFGSTVASVTNGGYVTGLSGGDVTFRFTNSSFCSNTINLHVDPKPIVSFVGPTGGCVGSTSSISSSTGSGGWTSEFPTIATIDNSGNILAVAPGTTRFRFQDGTTGCFSDWSTNYIVTVKPSVSASVTTLCVGGNTTLNSFGIIGVWTSSDTAIAKVNNQGVVTGIAAGSVTFTFREAGQGCPSDPLGLTISPRPTTTLTGNDNICFGGPTNLTTTFTASSVGGSWASNNNAIATINNSGVVTATGAGIVKFKYTSASGCESLESDPVTVNLPTPTSYPDPNACVGDTVTLFPVTGGTWTSSNSGIVSVISGADVRAIAEGQVTFNFLDTATGCTTLNPSLFTVNEVPPITFSATSVCLGNTSVQLFPNIGGTWSSLNPTVASIHVTSGVVTTLTPGTAQFQWESLSTGCLSAPSATLTITAGPTIGAPLDPQLCILETTTIAPNPVVAGSWSVFSASPIGTISISSGGTITANGQGIARVVFTDAAGCQSLPSALITVNEKPVVTGVPADICINNTFQLQPTNGTWSSTNSSVASVTPGPGAGGGLVTGLANGSARFIFTNSTTGCISDPSDSVRVGAAVTVGFSGPDVTCVGGTTQLFPQTGGTWVSNNPSVAQVNSASGLVTTRSAGFATFTFTATGCASSSTTDTLSVINCSNPDFNATFVNVPVPGDVSTNDPGGATTVYGTAPFLRSRPSGSSQTLTMNTNGTYTFTGNTVGVYIYEVPNCSATVTTNCPISILTIYVTDYTQPDRRPIANTDIASTFINTDVTIASLANDRCVTVAGCTLDPATVTVIDQPGNGLATVNPANGDITYDPNPTFTGIDTITYQVCVTGEPTNCATAKQYITVMSTTSINSTLAADDFAVTEEEVAVTGNVKTNDVDPEGNPTSVTANTITVAAGTFSVLANGDFTFTPVKGFVGPVEFVYQICDNHPTATDVCVEATVHILVLPVLTVKVRVLLEGALINNGNAQALDGRPLMRDDLRSNKFGPVLNQRFIPNTDPYKYNHPDYDFAGIFLNQVPTGDLKVIRNTTHTVSSLLTTRYAKFDSIPSYTAPNPVSNPSTVFAVTGSEAIVDWVKVELRSKLSNTTKVITRSGLLQRDGDVVELDGYSGLKFPGIPVDSYYVVVSHRTHLGAMSRDPQTPVQLFTLVNFTKDMPVFDFGTGLPTHYTTVAPGTDYTGLAQNNDVVNGYRALWAGNMDNSRKLKAVTPDDDIVIIQNDVLFYPTNFAFNSNYDFAFGYMPGDFNMDGKSKFDNPNDDKNFVYAQVLFHVLNTQFQANYDFIIEQVP
jgi:hypothetical protein